MWLMNHIKKVVFHHAMSFTCTLLTFFLSVISFFSLCFPRASLHLAPPMFFIQCLAKSSLKKSKFKPMQIHSLVQIK